MNYYIGLYSTNKAKRDIDAIMQRMGFTDIAVKMSERNAVERFFRKILCVVNTLFVLRKADTLLIQYPFKKYYATLCKIARRRGAKTITLIHDLGTFRRQKLTAEQEVKLLGHTDYIIVHNACMQAWLTAHGCKVPMGTLEIFDYLSSAEPAADDSAGKASFTNVVYAGGLHQRKNAFIYQLDPAVSGCHVDLYGPGEVEEEARGWQNMAYHGLIDSDTFIHSVRADWGLVWDGDTVDGCAGVWGSYLRINNPHKTSFYLRAGIPVIVWRESAMAPFVTRHQLGIAVGSLRELPARLPAITREEYLQYRQAAWAMKDRLDDGFYFQAAFEKASRALNEQA